MRSCNLIFITLLALWPPFLAGQALTNELPPAATAAIQANAATSAETQQGADSAPQSASATDAQLPDDPGQEVLPEAKPEPPPQIGTEITFSADRQIHDGDTTTLLGSVVVYYGDYVLHADRVVYHQSTQQIEAEGNLELAGGPDDILVHALHGDMRLNAHTARLFGVHGTLGVRRAGRTTVYTTTNPFVFSGRVLLQNGPGNYKIVDGSMTNCRLPHPDWRILSRSIDLADGTASTKNALFKFFGVPLFYLPYLRHPANDGGRESGILIPVLSNSSVKGLVVGEEIYWAINRSMDMTAGTEYYSKRGWAPLGDFRYKGPGLDNLTVRWNALLDRGIVLPVTYQPTPTSKFVLTTDQLVNQGGADILALGRKDFTPATKLAGSLEYLSSYVYRLTFNDNYSQAISSEVSSDLALTHTHNGFIPSLALDRFESFASATEGNEVRILHIPSLRYDILDHPLGSFGVYGGLGSSLSFLNRSEPDFHARNVGRVDIYPHLYLSLQGDGWSIVPEVALRETSYSVSETPDLTGTHCYFDHVDPQSCGIPYISHDPLHRSDVEAAVDIRPPALERDFLLPRWNRELRHVIEPEISYRFVGGIGSQARNVLRFDTTDIATDTDEVGVSLTQRFYLRSNRQGDCVPDAGAAAGQCPAKPREWASWQVAEKYFLNSDFGGALISGRRNVIDSSLNVTGVAFLTGPRDLSPVTSRIRFEAIDNLRIQWDMDYDPIAGRISSDNLFAGYSFGRSTVGLGHSLLNAVDENSSTATTIQSQQVQPYFSFGKPAGNGFNLAASAGYDFASSSLQYAGVEAVYNWNCCGLTLGYRRFELGSVRDDTQELFGFTLANFGTVGNVHRVNSVFRDPTLPPAY